MISHKHKFIFIHLPKCAGTSVEQALYNYASDISDIISGYKVNERHKQWYINTKNLRNEHLFDSINKHIDYFKFTFCRNPYDRLVSTYEFFNLSERYITFSNFINDSKLFENVKNIVDQDFCLNTNFEYHLLPGSYFIKHGVDFIGRFENLQQDFDIVCDKIKIPRQQLPHKKQSNHKHYTEYYDDETREIVAERYVKDIKYFGYEFGE